MGRSINYPTELDWVTYNLFVLNFLEICEDNRNILGDKARGKIGNETLLFELTTDLILSSTLLRHDILFECLKHHPAWAFHLRHKDSFSPKEHLEASSNLTNIIGDIC